MTVIAEMISQILMELVLALLGIAAAWVLARLAENQKLRCVNAAVEETAKAAKVTVRELQQTVVEGWKAAHSDGKLTEEEVRQLGSMLLQMTKEKISGHAEKIIAAAGADLSAIIRGQAEAFIQQMKSK